MKQAKIYINIKYIKFTCAVLGILGFVLLHIWTYFLEYISSPRGHGRKEREEQRPIYIWGTPNGWADLWACLAKQRAKQKKLTHRPYIGWLIMDQRFERVVGRSRKSCCIQKFSIFYVCRHTFVLWQELYGPKLRSLYRLFLFLELVYCLGKFQLVSPIDRSTFIPRQFQASSSFASQTWMGDYRWKEDTTNRRRLPSVPL